MTNRRLLTAVAGCAIALAPAMARADDDLEAMLEQSIVTTASQTAETKADAPATATVITAEDIHRHGLRSLNEALNYLSLGMFTTNPAHGVEAGARGVLIPIDYGNHILLLIDGHAVNEPYGGAASFDRGLGLPIELVDHIEVILGPGAVLYGSNAMLGVVNVVTKRAKDYDGLHVVADAELATWGKVGAGFGRSFTLLGRPFELTAALEYQHQDGPNLTFRHQDYGNDSVTGQPKRFSSEGAGTGVWGGTPRHSYYSTAPSAYARLASGNLEVALRASSYQRASPYLDALINDSGDFDARGVYELERWLFADVKYRIPVSGVVDLRTRAYADLYDYDWYNKTSAAEDCFEGQVNGCDRDLRGRARWVGGEVRGTFDWLKTGALVTMLGTDARRETVVANMETTPKGAGPRVEGGHVDTTNLRLGVYGQQTATPFHWLVLNAGARLDVAEGYPGALSPRAMAGIRPWKGAILKSIYSQAFRAPSSYERAWEDTYSLRAGHLRPEHEDSVEASFEQQLAGHRLMIGVFRTSWRDLVVSQDLSPDEIAAVQAAGTKIDGNYVSQYRNADTLRNYGYNAAVDGTLLARRLRYGLTVTGAQSQRGDGGASAPLVIAPTLYGNARASYDLGGDLPTVALAAQFAGRRPTDGAFTPTPYAPPVLELRAAVSGPVPHLTGLSYRVTANYAFERRGPYVIGPIRDSSYGVAPELNPVDRFRIGVGLQYVWAP
ncbi:MAG TPA: TonB-dependent receptor [Labilithrix sp.]|nr:TonB-dependent receptor [Labilithrix sp.]